jgi:hypothetical protein
MAYLRFSRDKRGYEHFSLVESTTNRRGKVRQRVLYWFRSPPDIRVGREPFDEAVRRALEAQNPNVTFDWRSILEAPIPSADADKWRERRRAERAAKQALAADTDDEPALAVVADVVENAQPEPTPVEAVAAGPLTPVANPGEGVRRKRRRRRGRRPATPVESGQSNGVLDAADSHESTEPAEPPEE